MKLIQTALLAGLVSTAIAQPIEFVIDQNQSTLDISIEIDLGALGGDTDADSTQVGGLVTASLDDPIVPSTITLHDFRAEMLDDLNFSWVPAFLSTANATLSGGSVEYANPGIDIGPNPIVDGSFEFLDVPATLTGILDVDYNIFLVGSGSQMIDLSTLGQSSAPISGEVVSANGTITISNTIELVASEPLVVEGNEIGTVIVTGTATMVATADVPECQPDLNNDGQLDFFDISAFLTAFSAQDPIADFNNDGAWDFFDISAFLTAYGAGCS
ncbi:MAG: hypothetical protein JJ974_04480 [Phycisphaerales bacterium]|nr:hypothetical protein [Phycisphaerales bacterium]